MARRILILIILVAGSFGIGQAQYVEDFENTEDLLTKNFWKDYFGSLFDDFTDVGDPFTSSGGIGLGLRSYSAQGTEERQDPFFYSLNANLNFRIFKINFPFTLMVSAKNTDSSLPNLQEMIDAFKDNAESVKNRFIRVGASPYYKWIRLHLGHRSMNFSQFTLSDLNFFGVGTDLTPGKWRLSAMYGRLAKAEPIDLSLSFPNEPVYQRIGWGFKLGYGDDNQSVDAILFKAADDPNSVFIPEDYWDQKAAEENMIFGLNAQKLFFERFRLYGEYAYSVFSPNAEDEIGDSKYFPSFLYKTRSTSEKSHALDAGLDFEGNAYTIGIQYTRVDPNYNSLGAFYFNRDIEDFVGNFDFTLFDGRVYSLLSAGVQWNNLKNEDETTTIQSIYSGEVVYSGESFSAGVNLTNDDFKLQYVLNPDLDSLNAVVVTMDIGLNTSYSIIDTFGNQHVWAATFNIQEVTDNIDDPFESAASQMILGNLNYNLILGRSEWSFNSQVNYNQNELAGILIKRYGGGLGVGKSFLDGNIYFNVNFDYFYNVNSFDETNSSLNGQLQTSYVISDGLNANFGISLLQTTDNIYGDFSELVGTMGMQYNFGYQPNWGRKKSDRLSREEMAELRAVKRQSKLERKKERAEARQLKREQKAREKAAGEAEKAVEKLEGSDQENIDKELEDNESDDTQKEDNE